MCKNKWRYLQLFAEGAAGDGGAASGAAGAETGVSAPDAGEQELLALGVPKGRISKRASAAVAKNMGKDGARVEKSTQQVAAAAVTEEGNNPEGAAAQAETGWQIPQGMTVDDIIKNPDVNKAIQGIISKRIKDGKGAAEAMEAMRPMLEVLSRQYGMDPGKLDYAKLSQAVEGDNRYYEDMAIANGVDVDTARQMDRDNRENQRQQEQLRQEHMRNQVAAWRQEEAQLKAQGLNVDLNAEAQNPTFVNLLKAGFGVKGAYEAVHHAEILEAAKKAAFTQAQTQTVDQIRSGNYRPAELGSAQAPASAPGPRLTPQAQAQIRARLERGQKVDPREFGLF